MLGLWLRNQIVIAREFGYNIKKETLQIWLATETNPALRMRWYGEY